MAVQSLPPTNTTTKPSTMNPRLPPLANKSSLTYKLTSLSKQKLAREATAPDPDIRRCLGHFRLHVMSMEWAQKEMTSRINSFELEDESDDEEEAVVDDVKEMAEQEVVPAQPSLPVSRKEEDEDSAAVADDEEDKEAKARFHVSFEQASTQPSSTAGSADLLDEVTTTIPPSGLPVHESEMASTNPLPTTHMQTQTNASQNSTPVNSDTEESEGEKEDAEDTATETDYETETQTDTETETAATDTEPEPELEPESDQKKSSDGTFFEKGRSCIEKSVQNSNFWPSSHGNCVPVRISG